MKLRTFLIVVAVVTLLYAIGLLLAPALMESSYGTESTASVMLSDRYFGSTLLAVALIAWLGKDLTGASARPIITGCLIGFAVGLVVSVMGTLNGTMNASGWSAVVLYLLLTLGCAYFQFLAPSK
jgi:uncharacterized membrane protein